MDKITIYDGADLKKLLESPHKSIGGRIKLKIHGLDVRENKRYEKRINAWLQDCGCEMGAAFTFMALCLYLIVWWTGQADMTVGRMLKEGLIVLFSAALVGKGIGILLAKIRLRLTLRKLLR